MRKFWLGIIGLAAASTVSANVVTFTLSVNDDGFGNGGATSTPGSFAVYADASSDTAGLFGWGVDLQGPINGIFVLGPAASYTKVGAQTKTAGFTTGVTEDTAGAKISGVTDLGAGLNLIPVYGLGQTGGDFSVTPPKPAGYTYHDLNKNFIGPAYNAHLLLGIGTFTGPASGIGFDVNPTDTKASTYVSNTSTVNAIADLAKKVVILGDVVVPDVFAVSNTAVGAQRATGDKIVVTGSNNLYVSEVDQLTSDSNSGTASVQTIGDEAGTLFVMAKVSGDAAAVSAILNEFNNGAANAEAAHLHQLYDGQFGPGGFNLLYTTANIAGAKNVNWDFSGGPNSGAVIDQLAVVPEPATMSLLGLGALGLLARRRRNA